jgi:hypothetical protein
MTTSAETHSGSLAATRIERFGGQTVGVGAKRISSGSESTVGMEG